MKVHRSPNCVHGEPDLSADQLSKWKQQLLENAVSLFASTDKQSDDAIERIAQIKQLVDRLMLGLESRKKLDLVELTLMAQQDRVEISVARRGHPWENGYAEKLIRTLKEKGVHLNAYENIHEARVSRIGHFITQVYHQKRPHSALGNHLTPVEFQRKKFVLTLLIYGLNKRGHFKVSCEAIHIRESRKRRGEIMPDIQTAELPKPLTQATVNIFGPSTNGTGFLCPCPFIDDIDTFFVVSNKHVLEGFNEKNVSIRLSQPIDKCYASLRPLSNTVYSHPGEKIDLACVIAYQSVNVPSVGQFHLEGLTPDYFSELPATIPNGSKLTTIGYPKHKRFDSNPLIQRVHLASALNVDSEEAPYIAIRPMSQEGESGSPVFIQHSERFFLLGVVFAQDRENKVGVVIKQHYVSELLDFTTESFKTQIN